MLLHNTRLSLAALDRTATTGSFDVTTGTNSSHTQRHVCCSHLMMDGRLARKEALPRRCDIAACKQAVLGICCEDDAAQSDDLL